MTRCCTYLTIARDAQAQRWSALIQRVGLSDDQVAQVQRSESYGPLLVALRDAQARGLDVEAGLPRLVAVRGLEDADDVAAVLHARVDTWVERAASRRQPTTDLVAGLIARAKDVKDPDIARALSERERAIEQRATELLEQAIREDAPWLRRLGQPPEPAALRATWLRQARVVAAYRELWDVRTPEPVGDTASTIEQRGHQKRAATAASRARRIAERARTPEHRQPHVDVAEPPAPEADRGPERPSPPR